MTAYRHRLRPTNFVPNFKINEDLCDSKKLKFVGKHASEIGMEDIAECVAEMKRVFASNVTRKLSFRRKQLQNLQKLLTQNKDAIADALKKDLGRDKLMAVMGDVPVGEVKHLLANLESLTAPKRVGMSIATFPGIDYEVYEPFGTVFISSVSRRHAQIVTVFH